MISTEFIFLLLLHLALSSFFSRVGHGWERCLCVCVCMVQDSPAVAVATHFYLVIFSFSLIILFWPKTAPTLLAIHTMHGHSMVLCLHTTDKRSRKKKEKEKRARSFVKAFTHSFQIYLKTILNVHSIILIILLSANGFLFCARRPQIEKQISPSTHKSQMPNKFALACWKSPVFHSAIFFCLHLLF